MALNTDATFEGNLTCALKNDYFWLFSKLQHTRSICDTLFDLKRSFEVPQKPWHHGRNKRK